MKIFFYNLFITTFLCFSLSLSQEITDDSDEIDFASPGVDADKKDDNDNECATSPHAELFKLLYVKLK